MDEQCGEEGGFGVQSWGMIHEANDFADLSYGEAEYLRRMSRKGYQKEWER